MSVNSLANFGVPGINGDRSAVLMPILTNRFRVIFYNFGTPGEVAPYDMTRAIKKIGTPTYNFDEAKLYSYISTVYIATRVEYEEMECALFDDIDNTVMDRVQMQLSKQQNFFDQTASRAGQNYKFEMDIQILAGGGAGASAQDPNAIRTWSVVGCWLKNGASSELAYEEPKPGENTLKIRFDNAIAFDQNGQQLGTFSHAAEIAGQVGDFSTGVGGAGF